MRSIRLFLVAVFLAASLPAGDSAAQQPTADPNAVERELLVPFDDLKTVLEHNARRVLLEREQYEELLAKAKKAPRTLAPLLSALLAGDYQVVVEEGRAKLTATLAVEVLHEGVQAVPLGIRGLGLRSAMLDDQPAAIGRAADGTLTLFATGPARRQLVMESVLPVEANAAQQSLPLDLPPTSTGKLHLTVPGQVEIKGGAQIVSRSIDATRNVTKLELLPPRGQATLAMSLNSRLLQKDRVVVARNVLVDELTEGYERLHLTASMNVLHGAVDQFRFDVPAGFEVTSVTAPQVSRWAVETADQKRTLSVQLRAPTSELVVLNISAARGPAKPAAWTLPQLVPLDVVGQAAVVGLLVDTRLKVHSFSPGGLIPVDTGILGSVLPKSFFQTDPGAPRVRPAAAYYSPLAGFNLGAVVERLPAEVYATNRLVLALGEKQQELRGAVTLAAAVEPLFHFELQVPPAWRVVEVTDAAGQPLRFEQYDSADPAARVRVKLTQPILVGQSQAINYRAVSTPDDWLTAWTTRAVEFPAVAVAGAARDVGTIAVLGQDDLAATPDKATGLAPIDKAEKSRLGLDDPAINLAYRFDARPLALTLNVERRKPRMTALGFSLFQIAPELLTAHYEIGYDVADARTDRLLFELPESTPAELAVRGMGEVTVKSFSGETIGKRRRWTVLLAQARTGSVRIAVDFQQPLTADARGVSLPVARAAGVARQAGFVSVEGHAEIDVKIDTRLRKVDVGELAAAEQQPGRRLLGAFGFAGDEPLVSVDVRRPAGYGLPAAIVKRAELTTLVAASGESQTSATLQLRTKATLLEVKLPAESQLWSAQLDGKPLLPQRQGRSVLISLPPAAEATVRRLQIVFETPLASIGWWGNVDLLAPKLLVKDEGGGAGVEVPLADLSWNVYLPAGYRLVSSDGTVMTEAIAARRSLASQVAESASDLTGRALYAMLPYKSEAKGLGMSGLSIHAPASDKSLAKEDGLQDSILFEGGKSKSTDPFAEGDMKDGAAKLAKEHKGEAGGRKESRDVAGDDSTAAKRPARKPPAPPAKPPQEEPPRDSAEPASGEKMIVAKPKFSEFAVEGRRSLRIELETQEQAIAFASLGADPRLIVTLVDQRRTSALAYAAALAVLLAGVLRTRRSVFAKAGFVVAVAAVSLLVPLVTGRDRALTDVFDMLLLAAATLAVYYVLAAIIRRIGQGIARVYGAAPARAAAAATATVLLLAVVGTIDTAHAQAPAPPAAAPAPPVVVPDDAIIVPFDPKDAQAIEKANKLLIPYDKYVELWNLAYPDKKIETQQPPAPFALAGGTFHAVLEGSDFLVVSGHLDIDVLVDQTVAIPLALEGGVLTQANLDGKPARLHAAQVAPPAAGPAPNQQAANAPPQAKQAPPAAPVLLLYTSGKGRQRLGLAARFRLERRGGWRVAAGRLPSAPATALTLEVPQAGTEVRLAGGADRATIETKADKQAILTAPGPDGAFSLQWRPKVAEAQADLSLSAQSTALFDVQEDGLRLAWQLDLEFRRSQREAFALIVPEGYLVEKVEGANVRGWQSGDGERSRRVEVTLLKAAQDREGLLLRLARRGAVGAGALAQVGVPVVEVEDAVLHQGTLVIRRSPLLELRTQQAEMVSRTDVPAEAIKQLVDASQADQSPLGILPYQSYRFAMTPLKLTLTAAPVAGRRTAEVQTIVGVAERERTFECRVVLTAEGRRVHSLKLRIPADLRVDHVEAPTLSDWTVTKEQDRAVLTVDLAAGRSEPLAVVVRGMLGAAGRVEQLPLPTLEVLGVERQSGTIVFTADPAFSLRAQQLAGCESALLASASSWLAAQHYALAQLAVRYETPGYSGAVLVAPRKARVSNISVTNVKFTDQAIEETIYLQFTIAEGGVGELAFQMPATLKDARIKGPPLRRTIVQPVDARAGSPLRVRLELQYEMTGRVSVLVENDRLPTAEKYRVPLPTVETGRTDRQYVTIERASSNELMTDSQEKLRPIGRQQAEWQSLATLLKRQDIAEAYYAAGDERPQLVLSSKPRAAVETAGARIGLAVAVLVLDESGAYRASQVYHVDNRTEQFLEVELPEGARLWTTLVAGESVKPASVAGKSGARVVRIPLVKTEAGDNDFAVELKYGGSLGRLGNLSSVKFPLPETKNVNVEQSQVRLRLPAAYGWFDFGGSVRPAEDETDLLAGYLSYKTRQIDKLSQVFSGQNAYAQVRAANTLKGLTQELQSYRRQGGERNEKLDEQWRFNTGTLIQAQREAEEAAVKQQSTATFDNRETVNAIVAEQVNGTTRGVVTLTDGNFKTPDDSGKPQGAQAGDDKFSEEWLKKQKLNVDEPEGKGGGKGRVDVRSLSEAAGNKQGKDALAPMRQPAAQSKPSDQPAATPPAQNDQGQNVGGGRRSGNASPTDNVRRYQQRLEQQQSAGSGSGGQAPAGGPQPAAPVTSNAPAQQPQRDGLAPADHSRPKSGVEIETMPGVDLTVPTTAVPATPTGLASLDVELPSRPGQIEYFFTTPRGKVEITAQAMASTLGDRLVRFGWLAASLLVLLGLYRRFGRSAATPATA